MVLQMELIYVHLVMKQGCCKMNEQQNKLFDLVNNNGYDMEDLIEDISYTEVNKLIDNFEEYIKLK